MSSLFDQPRLRGNITPRDYQKDDHDESFRLWDRGVRGTLTRAFTGAGKTLMACIKADTWLARGEDRRVMVVSYERQLVWQFAQEIEDYLGLTAGVEMEDSEVSPDDLPLITVVSRQSVLAHQSATEQQLRELQQYGITVAHGCTKARAQKYLKYLKMEGDTGVVQQDMEDAAQSPECVNGVWSRLHKFDWRLKWLVIFDEAHRHTHKMASVGHIVDWFDQNPDSRRTGLTATPKRGDNVSIGDKMFPELSLDYPLFALRRKCAVRDGWAVPYVQQYIEVAGVDFKNIKQVAGDYDDNALADALMGTAGVSLDEQAKRKEEALAKLVLPLLEKVGNRKTLIFSPTVEMAKDVAHFINARAEAQCSCGIINWYPRLLIGDGAQCTCGNFIVSEMITKSELQARQLDGNSHATQRRAVYDGHQNGDFQFLSVCGLCREGYNDPDISCVAVFRPVSKKASSLAEQMKGRGCRPCRKIARKLGDLPDAEARLRMIAESDKPNCLIVDLVGITGLADCASTVEIYADGLPDEVKARAEEELLEAGMDEEVDVEEVIANAQKKVDEEKEKARQEREAAERKSREEAELRAKANAQARYTTHDVGYGSNVNPNEATERMMNFLAFLGLKVTRAILSRKQAGRMISQLRLRTPPEEVARTNNLDDTQWERQGPTFKQARCLRGKGINLDKISGYEASQYISAIKQPAEYVAEKIQEIAKAKSSDDLTGIGKDIAMVQRFLSSELYQQVVSAGQAKRQQFSRFQGAM